MNLWQNILAGAVVSFGAAPVLAADFSFQGMWHVDRIVGYSEISESPREVRKLIGRRVVITADRIVVGGDDCKADSMKISVRETERLLFDQYRAGVTDAGVPSKTQVLEAEPCGYVFREGSRIIVFQNGAFYRASRLQK